MLRSTIPAHAFFVVDAGIGLKPDDFVLRTMCLGCCLREENRQLAALTGGGVARRLDASAVGALDIGNEQPQGSKGGQHTTPS